MDFPLRRTGTRRKGLQGRARHRRAGYPTRRKLCRGVRRVCAPSPRKLDGRARGSVAPPDVMVGDRRDVARIVTEPEDGVVINPAGLRAVLRDDRRDRPYCRFAGSAPKARTAGTPTSTRIEQACRRRCARPTCSAIRTTRPAACCRARSSSRSPTFRRALRRRRHLGQDPRAAHARKAQPTRRSGGARRRRKRAVTITSASKSGTSPGAEVRGARPGSARNDSDAGALPGKASLPRRALRRPSRQSPLSSRRRVAC